MDRTLFFIVVFFSQFYFSQGKTLSKIDSLKNDLEVENFIHSCSKDKTDALAKFELRTIKNFSVDLISNKIKKIADSLGIKQSYYKGDFDHNGKTDLLFIGDNKKCITYSKETDESFCDTSVNVIFDRDNTYVLKDLLPNHHDFVVPRPLQINGKDYISIFYELNGFIFESEKEKERTLSQTLTYQWDDFIEYNPNPPSHSITKIVYQTSQCFGTCPIFTLELNKKGSSSFRAKVFNFIDENDPKAEEKAMKNYKKGEGNFTTQIRSADFEKIEKILNYINFPTLQDGYAVSWTDDQSSRLKITYDNGKTKTIEDYGLVGTYGLKSLYKMLFDLRFNQDWKKVK